MVVFKKVKLFCYSCHNIRLVKFITGGTVRLNQFAGRQLPVMPGSSSSKPKQSENILTTSQMINIQQVTGLSNANMRQLASCLNKSTPQGVGVEPYFQTKFSQAGQTLKAFYSVAKLELQSKGEIVERTTVFCNDLDEFVRHALHSRNYSPQETIVKLGMDGGGGFFKICISLVDLDSSISPEMKKRKLAFHQHSLSTSVKKLFIVSIVEDVTESHANIGSLLKNLNLEKVNLVVACDLKVANILCGIQSHSSMHPCCFCDVSKDNLVHCGKPRTFGSLKQFSQKYQASSSKSAKDFYNCVNEPLLLHKDDTRVIDIIPPPELHLLLGVVNHLYSGLKAIWPMVEEWPKMLYIKTVSYHGGNSFNGPACHKLLQSIDKLEAISQTNNAFHVQPWITALRHFKDVVHSCFGMTLGENFSDHIAKFTASCISLPISVTPKMHIVFHHVLHFIEKEKKSLGIFSEQAAETVHHDFASHWNDRYKRQMNHPDYSSQLLNAVVEYNSKHM